ncbi:hypothetical protein EYC84_008918 [Monilinia fructicola]|uniref:Uncharacterized protein n=1 Tax=Monilinia fructicola TaxID=38448 RepID=A0A5M9JD93_MONFR|nr:hypothetical protein EYC84_008918 [Monilinia fructicola]
MKFGKFEGSGCMNAGMIIICIGIDWIGCGRAELGKHLLHFSPWRVGNNFAPDVVEEHLSGIIHLPSISALLSFTLSERRDMLTSIEKPPIQPKKRKKRLQPRNLPVSLSTMSFFIDLIAACLFKSHPYASRKTLALTSKNPLIH